MHWDQTKCPVYKRCPDFRCPHLGVPLYSDDHSYTTVSNYRLEKFIALIQQLLSRGANPNLSRVPLHPLFYSVLVGEEDVVRKLLECGARTDQCLPDEVGTVSQSAMVRVVDGVAF